jgi:hypothetical protein
MQNTTPTRRITVNGKVLTYKQTAQFEKFMAESETFRANFVRLAKESGIL